LGEIFLFREISGFFPKPRSWRALEIDTMSEDEEALERLYALDWNQISLSLLVFARYWAKTHYFWKDGTYLPEGKTPEDIVTEAVGAFWSGARKWNRQVAVVTQLKGAVRSILSNLHKKKGSKLTSTEEPAFFESEHDDKPDPATEYATNDYCKSIFEALYQQEQVLNSEELMMIVMAYKDAAESIDDVVAKTEIPKDRVYELRRTLKGLKQGVIEALNEENI
jgi:hypothetical protein